MGKLLTGGLSELQKWRKSYWVWDDIVKGYIFDLEFRDSKKDIITVVYVAEDKVTRLPPSNYSSLELRQYLYDNYGKFSYWGKRSG